MKDTINYHDALRHMNIHNLIHRSFKPKQFKINVGKLMDNFLNNRRIEDLEKQWKNKKWQFNI